MPVFAWDVNWFLWINRSEHSVFLDWILSPIAHYGDWVLFFSLLVMPFLDRKRGKLVCLMGLFAAATSSYVGNTLLKPLVKHPRPPTVPELASQIHLLAQIPSSYSFPSGAATVSFAVAGVIAYFYSGWKRVVVLAAAAVISYSRVYVGVHFPSDVIGGMLIGLAIGLGGTALADRWRARAHAAN